MYFPHFNNHIITRHFPINILTQNSLENEKYSRIQTVLDSLQNADVSSQQ